MTEGRVFTVVQQLEGDVGASLLQRTARRVRLASDDEQFIERCEELVAEAEALQTMFRPAVAG